MVGDWNFPYWNDASHDNAMMFHCGNMKITEKNDQNMLALVWQNSQRARWFNSSQIAEYAPYANTPEIYIAVSQDNGGHWSEPIVINNQETPQFAGLTTTPGVQTPILPQNSRMMVAELCSQKFKLPSPAWLTKILLLLL
jgi:Neuraminidase (sialidase)